MSTIPPPPHRILDHVKVKGKKDAVQLVQLLDEDYSETLLQEFESARLLYEGRNWDAAIAGFEKAHETCMKEMNRSDETIKMYIKRCENFKENPPPANWDKSWTMTEK